MDKPKEFSATYFRAQCDGSLTPETKGEPKKQIHGHTAKFRILREFIVCSFDAAGESESEESNPFKFHINIEPSEGHTKLEQAWAVVVDVCAAQGIGLVKVLNMGQLERDDAQRREYEAKQKLEAESKPAPKHTPEQEEEYRKKQAVKEEQRRVQQIMDPEQRRKKNHHLLRTHRLEK